MYVVTRLFVVIVNRQHLLKLSEHRSCAKGVLKRRKSAKDGHRTPPNSPDMTVGIRAVKKVSFADDLCGDVSGNDTHQETKENRVASPKVFLIH